MRVLIAGVNYAPERTGIAPYTTGLAEALAARGHVIKVVTSVPHYPQWRAPSAYDRPPWQQVSVGVNLERVRPYIPREPTVIRRTLFEMSFGTKVLSRDWGLPDVIVCPSPALLSSAMVTMRARVRRARIPVVLWVQDLYSSGSRELGLSASKRRSLALIESRTLRASDAVVTIHERFKEQIARMGVARQRVHVIRNWTHISPVNPSDRASVRRELGWTDSEVIVVHSGAMGEKQGLENVIEAARRAQRQGVSVRFLLIGDGSQRTRLEALADGLGTIEFKDALAAERYPHALAAADILLVNERAGVAEMAVPSKLTSYMAAARPIVAACAEDGTTAEELVRSRAGVRVQPGRPEELLEAVLRLAHAPLVSEQLGQNGLGYCERVLSKRLSIEKFEDLLNDVVSREKV